MIKKTTIPITFLIIEGDGCHLLIKARINRKPATLLIDTGASKTVFDKNRIGQFVNEKNFRSMDKLSSGLGTNSMKTHAATLKQFKLGTFTITDFEAILLDLAHVNSSYEMLKFPAIDGVLGSDVMLKCKAVIDYKSKKLVLQWKKNTGKR